MQSLDLTCLFCTVSVPSSATNVACPSCGGMLIVEHAVDRHDRFVPASTPGLWRYHQLLDAGHNAGPVTLGEGMTPVVALPRWGEHIGLPNVFAKLEYFAPTGSFKDRGAAVMVTKARELGARRLVEDSSGNAGAAVAAYAARAGLPCTIYAPAAAPTAKLSQIIAAGAKLVRVEGPREAVAAAAMADTADDSYYAGHNTNPYFVEGTRTFAFELAEQFHGDLPEHLIMPVGGGSLYLGAWLGFSEWLGAGRINHLPRMHLAQSAGCAPLVAALNAGAERAVTVPRHPTIAGGVTIERPARDRILLHIARQSSGAAEAVDDPAIYAAMRSLAVLEGLACEPTSAVAFAALAGLARRGVIPAGERVVVAVTGSALKDGDALLQAAGRG